MNNDAGFCANCGARLSRYEENRWQQANRTPDEANCFECEPEEMTLVRVQPKDQKA